MSARRQKRDGIPGNRVYIAGKCPHDGKDRFLSRRQAKAAAKARSHVAVTVYLCDGYWHLGHLPTVVSRGRADRSAVQTHRTPDHG